MSRRRSFACAGYRLVKGCSAKRSASESVIRKAPNLGQPLAGRAQTDNLLRDTIVYLTCVHELGHAVGLAHTRDFQDIMYSFGYGGDIVAYFMRYRDKLKSREDIAKFSGLSPADATELRALYNKPINMLGSKPGPARPAK